MSMIYIRKIIASLNHNHTDNNDNNNNKENNTKLQKAIIRIAKE